MNSHVDTYILRQFFSDNLVKQMFESEVFGSKTEYIFKILIGNMGDHRSSLLKKKKRFSIFWHHSEKEELSHPCQWFPTQPGHWHLCDVTSSCSPSLPELPWGRSSLSSPELLPSSLLGIFLPKNAAWPASHLRSKAAAPERPCSPTPPKMATSTLHGHLHTFQTLVSREYTCFTMLC